MINQEYELSYDSNGNQLLQDNIGVLLIGYPRFIFFSFYQEYKIRKDKKDLIRIAFKCFSNYYFSLKIQYQNFEFPIVINLERTLLSLTIKSSIIKLIPNEYIINKEFLFITVNNVKIGSVFRKRLKFGSDIYNIKIYEKTELLDYILIICMINLNNYR